MQPLAASLAALSVGLGGIKSHAALSSAFLSMAVGLGAASISISFPSSIGR